MALGQPPCDGEGEASPKGRLPTRVTEQQDGRNLVLDDVIELLNYPTLELSYPWTSGDRLIPFLVV